MIYFNTFKFEPVGWGLEEDTPWRVRFLAKPSLAIISTFSNWGATETVITPWEGTEEELLKLANDNPKKLILYALKYMDTEHADRIDGLIGNCEEDDEIYVNGREVKIDSWK